MLRPLLVLALLLPAAPVVSAAEVHDVECDKDDDLYHHCRAGRVHWVTGPGPCAGVRLDAKAPCRVLIDPA